MACKGSGVQIPSAPRRSLRDLTAQGPVKPGLLHGRGRSSGFFGSLRVPQSGTWANCSTPHGIQGLGCSDLTAQGPVKPGLLHAPVDLVVRGLSHESGGFELPICLRGGATACCGPIRCGGPHREKVQIPSAPREPALGAGSLAVCVCPRRPLSDCSMMCGFFSLLANLAAGKALDARENARERSSLALLVVLQPGERIGCGSRHPSATELAGRQSRRNLGATLGALPSLRGTLSVD